MRSAWPGGCTRAAQGGMGPGSSPQPRRGLGGSASNPKTPQQRRPGSRCCPRRPGTHRGASVGSFLCLRRGCVAAGAAVVMKERRMRGRRGGRKILHSLVIREVSSQTDRTCPVSFKIDYFSFHLSFRSSDYLGNLGDPSEGALEPPKPRHAGGPPMSPGLPLQEAPPLLLSRLSLSPPRRIKFPTEPLC